MKKILPLILSICFIQIAFGQLVLERDINQEAASSNPEYIAELNNQLYFRADDGINGEELYRYDISTGDVTLVADIRPYDAGGSPSAVISFDEKIYFVSRDEILNNDYLFIHDPLDNSTQRLMDNQGSDVEEPSNLFVFNGQLFFSAEFAEGVELGRYDPVANSIIMVDDLNPDGDSYPNFFNEVDGKLWFTATNGGQTDSRLWSYDPVTEQVENILYNSPDGVYPSMSFLYHYDGKFFFRGHTQANGEELWRYDIATNTLLETPEIYLGPASSSPSGFKAFNGKLYFAARTVGEGREIRVYDPATETVSLVADILTEGNGNSNPGSIVELGDKIYFTATVNTNQERKLFAYNEDDGLSEAGILDNNDDPNYLTILFENNATIYLSGNQVENGTELYKFAPGGTVELAADINQTTVGSDPYSFTVYNGKLYFGADEINSGTEIWVYDPTTGLVEILSDLPGSTLPNFLTPLDGKLYFTGNHPVEGYGLLFYDESTGEINPTAYITPNNTGHITSLTVYNDLLYFSAIDEDFDRELFVYRPGDNSFERLTDLNPNGGSSVEDLFVFENELYFRADDGQAGRELWKYSDLTGMASLVVDINPGADGSSLGWFEIYDNEIYFAAFGENTTKQVFSYNTTTQELTQRTDISGNLDPRHLRVYRDRLFFSGRFSSSIGRELMSYDAATDETILVEDLSAGSSSPAEMIVFDDKLYYSASTDTFGRELWQYNDTIMSIVADIRPGVPSSEPTRFYLFNDKLYFTANDGIRGSELWSIAECLNLFVDTEPQVGSEESGAVDLNIEGGTPPYSIEWSNGAETEDITDLQSGFYTATVTDATGCIAEITAEVTFVSGTENVLDASLIRVFPNPSQGTFTVNTDGLKVETLEVLDMNGRFIYQKNNLDSSEQIEVQLHYAIPGIYIMRVRNADGVGYKKIVLE